MEISKIEKFIITGFYSGYLPKAPGTFGSLVALGIYLIPGFENVTVMLVMISLFTLLGLNICNKLKNSWGKDPKEIVIDEFVGTWISLLFLPKKIIFILIAFVLWRFLDIIKIFPAKQLEKLPYGYGIMLDDILAGFYTFFIIQLTINYLYL